MHMEYRVRLPDHDWVVAQGHKLIPSVYAGIVIQPNGLGKPEAVGYSGPTYVAIRAAKYCSSTAASHGLDLERLLSIPEFDDLTKSGEEKSIKPVVIITGKFKPFHGLEIMFYLKKCLLFFNYNTIIICS